jgi:hypothetical protein
MSPYFAIECPVCGRPLHVASAYDGRHVKCQHCRGCFVARCDTDADNASIADVNRLVGGLVPTDKQQTHTAAGR